MAAVGGTRTILNLKMSASKPAGHSRGAPNCGLEQRRRNRQTGLPTQLLSWTFDLLQRRDEGASKWLELPPPPPHCPLRVLCVCAVASQRTLLPPLGWSRLARSPSPWPLPRESFTPLSWTCLQDWMGALAVLGSLARWERGWLACSPPRGLLLPGSQEEGRTRGQRVLPAQRALGLRDLSPGLAGTGPGLHPQRRAPGPPWVTPGTKRPHPGSGSPAFGGTMKVKSGCSG